ncbi:MAG: DUF2334 domain-containing protein [Pseudobdellovibrionaceae bacterium]
MKSSILISILFICLQSHAAVEKCVNVYFDRSTNPSYWMGKTYANFVQNLLGHFPEFQQVVSPIEMYKKGDIEKCDATIYIGSYFNNLIPADFLEDFAQTKKNIAWLGYNIWQLGDRFTKALGYKYARLSTLNKEAVDTLGRPSFYKNIHYKDAVFYKYGEWSKTTPNLFLAPFEQALLVPSSDVSGSSDGAVGSQSKTEVLAWSENPVTGEKAPYMLRAKNYFYVADIPLSFMHEADRYLVFADILFDLLNSAPKHSEKYAFLRIEDVHPLVPLNWLYAISRILKEENVPMNISLIPIFYDPLKQFPRGPLEELVPMDRRRDFLSWISDAKQDKATFIWHGVTHQYNKTPNPHDALSGADFEFFDANANKPLLEDSPSYVLDKLEDGFEVLQHAGITPRMWLMPHYQASPLDYIIMGQVFSWNVGRAIYYNSSAQGLNTNGDDHRLWFQTNYPNARALRFETFKNLSVHYESNIWSGQFFPYEIYGDIYGQRLIPENLGNSQPYVGDHVINPRTKEDIVACAKRNIVLRDVWASFFYHPFLLTPYDQGGRGAYPGDPSELRFLIKEIKKLGYQFIDINEFLNKNTLNKRPQPVYKEESL